MRNKSPFVIHVNEMSEFTDAVYIGRKMHRQGFQASKWANPYRVDEMGREQAVEMYRDRAKHMYTPADLEELTGKPLACWCRRSDEAVHDGNSCHGDVLIDLWNRVYGEMPSPKR